jgi:hypothetical protein
MEKGGQRQLSLSVEAKLNGLSLITIGRGVHFSFSRVEVSGVGGAA